MTSIKVAIVDNDFGTAINLLRMFNYLGHEAHLESNPYNLNGYSHLVLPGVGSFSNGAQRLESSGFGDAIRAFSDTGKPILGVCLGMQLLGVGSCEGPGRGLALLNFNSIPVAKFGGQKAHIGWSPVHWLDEEKSRSYFYFNHSFCAPANNPQAVAHAIFETEFACAVREENVLGVQFHPEKSHRFGFDFVNQFALEFPR